MSGPTQDVKRRLHQCAFAQAGYFTAAQAVDLGYSYQSQKYHVDQGNWQRIDRGLFRLPGWPTERTDPYARWVLWSGGRGVVSHESALALHDLSDVNPALVHLTVPTGFRARNTAVATHVGEVGADDFEVWGSWRLTTVERTLLDVAGSSLPQEIVNAAVADALRDEMVRSRRLHRRAAESDDRTALRLERALAQSGDA